MWDFLIPFCPVCENAINTNLLKEKFSPTISKGESENSGSKSTESNEDEPLMFQNNENLEDCIDRKINLNDID